MIEYHNVRKNVKFEHKKLISILICLLTTLPLSAQIAGSTHDFQNESWNTTGEICIVCHTPHNSDTPQQNAPLWNHQTTVSSFTLYSSPTLDTLPLQPQNNTRLCLSCHDGTVALDSFGGNGAGSTLLTLPASLGTDLSNDHPVSIKWEHQLAVGSNGCATCHITHPFGFNDEVPFYDGYIECATCHDVHGGAGNPKLLRKPMTNSALCFHCHGK